MKKIILSLTSALFTCAAFAQSCVSVQQVSTNYATKQITFDLKWGTCNNTNHLYRVWVFVDYRSVTNVTKGAWGRASITATDKGTLVSANKGVWVTGSANTTQRVTLTLDVIGDKFDWCAIAIDYPPNATIENGVYALRGTPPFIVDGVQLDDTRKTQPAGIYCLTSITDATGNPDGFINNFNCSCTTINLGNVGFTSTQTWVVGAQTWSAPVTATYCNKSGYYVSGSAPYASDCRTNSAAAYGHLFSWCMVARFAASLCPGDWRVPTVDEFIALNKTLGGSRNNYLNNWGLQWMGHCFNNGSFSAQGERAYYWTQSAAPWDCGYRPYFHVNGVVDPSQYTEKYYGFALRCIK